MTVHSGICMTGFECFYAVGHGSQFRWVIGSWVTLLDPLPAMMGNTLAPSFYILIISVTGGPIWTKFRSSMQNNTPITVKWLRSKPEINFHNGGRLFFQSGNSCGSAVNWAMSTQFGLQIYFDLLKIATSTNRKPEVVLGRHGSHREKSIWRHISAVAGPIWMKFGRLVHNNTPITVKCQKWNHR